MAGDKDTLQTFEFVLGDYDTKHWYWEVNEMQSHSIEVDFSTFFNKNFS